MAKKFKLNKAELTRLKREEKIYSQFLPVLKLKQEQLQMEQLRIKRELQGTKAELDKTKAHYESLIALLPDPMPIDIIDAIKVKKLVIGQKSIAGVKVPTLDDVIFNNIHLSYFGFPAWFVRGLSELHRLAYLDAKAKISSRQFELISKELKKASQKVNLFEKVLVPETKEAIKRIKIALGDEQVAAVGRGKIAKAKRANIDLTPNFEEQMGTAL